VKYFPLLWAALWRKRVRTWLTLLSIVVAFLLFGLLQSVSSAFTRGVDIAGADRLITNGRYSLTELLPLAYRQQIAQVEGVTLVTPRLWFGGWYQDPRAHLAAFVVDPVTDLEVYREIRLPEDQRRRFQQQRASVLAGRPMANRYGWSVGDRIPINSQIWTRSDGSMAWEFEVAGIFEIDRDIAGGPGNPDVLLINFDYFDEERQFAHGFIGWYVMRIADAGGSERIAREIDALFANSRNETKTQTEEQFATAFVNQIGNIGLIVTGILGAVFFTLLLLTGNTMMQSVRERIPELAVLKTLGFTDATVMALVLAESLLLALGGAMLGLLAAAYVVPVMAQQLALLLPGLEMEPGTFVTGIACALLLGTVVGLPPALRAMRVQIVEALAEPL
jgi:putative ABC transport system permease protein